MILLFLLIASFVVALYSSVVGGGYLVTIPLLTLLGVPVPVAIATLRLSSVMQQGTTVAAFSRKQAINWLPALWMGLWSVPGAYLGARLLLHLNEKVISLSIAILMLLLLVLIPRIDLKIRRKKKKLPGHWLFILALFGLPLGIYGGFYGAGFSTFVMVIFLLVGNSNFISSSAEASVVTFCMSVVASYPFLTSHLINWSYLLPLTIGGCLGAWLGVNWAVRFGTDWIKRLLFILVIASVLKIGFSYL